MTDLHDLDISHHFAGGIYAKQTVIPAGMVLAQHRHEFAHLSILATGAVMLACDGQSRVLRAPCCVTIPPNTHHLVRALTDSVWYCLWPDEAPDEDRIEPPTIDMHAQASAMAQELP